MKAVVTLFTFTLFFVVTSPSRATANEEQAWEALRSGQAIALIRHAIAPGTGDPEQFEIRKCNTQRNLSNEGRQQAKRISALMKAKGIKSAQMYSSQWCRCLETAKLIDLGTVTELTIINSFFQNFERQDPQTEALRKWLNANRTDKAPTILVTHQVNITALTGVYPLSGEIVIVQPTEPEKVITLARVRTE